MDVTHLIVDDLFVDPDRKKLITLLEIKVSRNRIRVINREMIFKQPFFDNFCNNFLSHTHSVLPLSFYIALIFVSLT